MPETTRRVTAEELERFPSDDRRYELVEGRLVPMSPVRFEHGRVVVRLSVLLGNHLERFPVGVVATDVGFKLKSNPDTVRGPDIAFIRNDRIPPKSARGFVNGAPDLVIEVLSPEDRPGEVSAKVREYLSRGVVLVVVIDPDARAVSTHHAGRPSVTLRSDDDVLDLRNVISGFRCTLRAIFDDPAPRPSTSHRRVRKPGGANRARSGGR
jgi:Uma2 family endonuclease